MGVHIKRKLCKLARELGDSELVIYMLDDVQVQYGDYHFWFRLLDVPNWNSSDLSVIISTIYSIVPIGNYHLKLFPLA
ncbi:hypothetical protein F441_00319 [Phytophthora nicotianae CJ01A1]|uniref:Uncharacterized protein n=1 Tax=Phytophthora nicotianae CJ01A1 TaxID=1317063 RepID=W2XXM2_PHYNI|nr:hypothetical protein F441_00319 [Phytophthora nicotianae CJ01A1]